MTPGSERFSEDGGNVWAVFYRAVRTFSDVAVPAARQDDLREWQIARDGARHNAKIYAAEASRWATIADDLAERCS
jgi:hypothetical protein